MLFAAEAYQTEGHVRLHNVVISDEKQIKSEMYEKRDVSRHLARGEIENFWGTDRRMTVVGSNGQKESNRDAERGVNPASGEKMFIPAHTGLVSSVVFDKQHGRFVLASSFDQTAKLWTAKTWQPLRELKGHSQKLTGCDISPDGSLIATCSFDRTFKLWGND